MLWSGSVALAADTPKAIAHGKDATVTPLAVWTEGGTQKAGKLQWVFKGFPVYVFLDDAQPGDTGGRGYASGIAVATAWTPIMQTYLVEPVGR